MTDMLDIDLNSIKPENIKVKFSEEALKQLKLMKDHDYTLEKLCLRVQIGGKGCDGFSYNIGFDSKKENDYLLERNGIKVLMQPFTAFYCQDISVEYLINPDTFADGFSVTNHRQKEFEGKFFKA